MNRLTHRREDWFGTRVPPSDTGLYRIRESILRPEGYVYVLGQVLALDKGEAVIRFPQAGYMDPRKKYFIICRKNEQGLTLKKQRMGRALTVIGVCLLIGFLYCLLGYFGFIPGVKG